MVAHRLSPSGPFVTGDRLRWYGDTPSASVPEQELFAARSENDFSTGPEESVTAVQAEGYPLGIFAVQRFIFGGPPVGDTDIIYRLGYFTALGDPITLIPESEIRFAPDEAGTKQTGVGVVAPKNALLVVQAVYPANYDPSGGDEATFFVAEVVA